MSNPSPPAPSPDAPKSTGDPTHTASSRSGGSDRLRIVRNLLIATENNRAAVRTWFGPPSVRRRLRRKLLGLRTMPTGPRTTPSSVLRRGLLVAKANSRLRVPSNPTTYRFLCPNRAGFAVRSAYSGYWNAWSLSSRRPPSPHLSSLQRRRAPGICGRISAPPIQARPAPSTSR